MIGIFYDEEKRCFIYEVFVFLGYNLMVMLKEVDMFIEDMVNVVVGGFNVVLYYEVD